MPQYRILTACICVGVYVAGWKKFRRLHVISKESLAIESPILLNGLVYSFDNLHYVWMCASLCAWLCGCPTNCVGVCVNV